MSKRALINRMTVCIGLCGRGDWRIKYVCCCCFFFFQAEDGIRDWSVTGVQTCALPIWLVDSVDPNTASFKSITTRWQGWKFAIQMFQDRPVAGWGWQSFDDQWLAQVPEPAATLHHAHNI